MQIEREGISGIKFNIINIGNYFAINPHLLEAINISISCP